MRLDIDALRAQTPGCATRIHLNNAGAGLLAQPTIEAMTSHLRREVEIGAYEAAAQAEAAVAAVYAAVAELVGGRSEEMLRDQLAALPGVTVHDLGRVRCAIVTAKIRGVPAEQAAEALGRARVNVTTTVPEDNPLDTEDRGVHPLIRFSPHYYNTEDEIDRAAQLVAGLAG